MSFFERFKIKARDGRSRSSERIDTLLALVNERPDDWATENELADALVECGRIDQAVTHLCAIGDRLAADGFIAKAHAFYKKALRLRPNSAHAMQRVAELSVERMNQAGKRLPLTVDDPGPSEAVASDVATAEPTAPPAEVTAPPPASAESPSQFTFEPTSYQAPEDEATPPVDSPAPIEPADEPQLPAEHADALSTDAAQTVEQIVADAEFGATYGGVSGAVTALMDCARANPDAIEPVAKLAEIAAAHGLDDVLADAEARLCDLYCRRGDYGAARTVAEALVMRYPDDMRHRARLMFVEGELYQDEAPSEIPSHEEVALDAVDSTPESAADAEFQRALDALLAGDDETDDEGGLTGARAALERAADTPRHRLAACRQLARLDAEAGRWMSALAWLENAALAIDSPADEEDLAYEMAIVLERAGEHDRALGVFSEIATKAGPEYRDISDRIARLSSTGQAMQEQLVAS